MLYLIATPIGNLSDITLRALAVLKTCDYILCEDTRHSRHLLAHHQIDRPLKSYHSFNEKKKLASILSDLRNGKEIALISDAGTPLLCDPGESLVLACHAEGLCVTTLPGPSALMAALCLSGLPPLPFQFLGFLPKKKKELAACLTQALFYAGTTIAYDTPHQILKSLQSLQEIAPHHPLVLFRELTKRHEERLSGNAKPLLTHFTTHPPRGELVLLFGKAPEEAPALILSIDEQVRSLMKHRHLSLKEAIKETAKLRKVPKQTIYRHIHKGG